MIRLPVHVMERARRFLGVRAAHPNYTEAELIEEIITLGYATSAKEIRHLLNLGDLYLNTTSLNVLVGEDEETELEEFIPSDSSVEDVVEQTFLRESLENVLSTLTPREEKILRLRFGFDDGIERTLEDVGKMFLAISMNTISILGHISISSLMRGKTLQNAIWSSSTP